MMKSEPKLFQGAGGSKSSTPTNTPDTLFSEDIVEFALAVSEGPIRGLTEGAKSFYVGGTALQAADGTKNFEKFAIGVHPGFPGGSARPLGLKLGGITSSTSVGVNLLSQVEVTRTTPPVLRNSVDQLEVRLYFNRLVRTNDAGTFQATARFKIEYRPASGGAWVSFDPTASNGEMTIAGKTSSGYAKDFSIPVPRMVNDDWMLRVTKISPDYLTPAETPDTTPDTTIVDINWESFQCTTKGAVTYPDTAIVHGLGTANGQFSSLPDFAGIYDGLVVRVPTNYNSDLRTYDESSPWDGSFKFAWTNNPAWVLYDLLVNPRYGIASHRMQIDPNRFDFYLAGKWCDVPVPTGVGATTQPRYTFNDVLSESRPGMEALAYVAGSFNALVWDDLNGQIHLRVDKDEPAVMMFTPESVTEEGFGYSFTDIAVRANDISVSFINPDLDWNEDRRRIPNVTTDEAAIQKFGRIPLDFIAVGCTNVHEAIRKARVRLLSAQTETTMVNFVTTRQGALLSLFDVILIADPAMGWSVSGRLTSFDETWMNFRDAIYIETMKQYTVKLQTAEGIHEVRVTPEAIGNVTRLRLDDPMPLKVPRYTTFTLEETGGFGFAKPFRVTAISEVDGSPYLYSISAIEINRTKYYDAENGTTTPEFDYSFRQPTRPLTPLQLTADSGSDQLLVDSTGVVTTRIRASWSNPPGSLAASFELQWQQEEDSDWNTLSTDQVWAYISPVMKEAVYLLRVRSVDPDGRKSDWSATLSHTVTGKAVVPFGLVSFSATGQLFQNDLSWVYGTALDIRKIEIRGSNGPTLASAVPLVDLAYPTNKWSHIGLGVGVRVYYWARIQDTSGNYSAFTTGISAATIDNPRVIKDLLVASITESDLYEELRDRIDLIDGPVDLANSVAALLQLEGETRNAEILAEAEARGLAIYSEQIARADATSALTSQVEALVAKVGANKASITAEKTARVTADAAEALARQQVTTAFQAADQAVYTQAQGYVQSYSYSKSSADSAIAAAATNLTTSYTAYADAARTDAISTAAADVRSYSYSKSEATQSTALVYTNLIASFTAADNAILANARNDSRAFVQSYSYSKASADSAIARQVTTLSTTLGSNTSTLEIQAESIDGIFAQYTVKIDNNGYITGYGLASTIANGVPSSEFIVNADRFAIVAPGASRKVPFVVGTVNGVTAVGINGALIVDGTITANSIDTRGLEIKDASGNVIFSSGTSLDYSQIGGTKPPANATNGATIGVNLGGQITPANISTYIANLAVDTAQIKGNAVTVITVAPAANTQVSVGDSWVTLTSVSLTVNGAQPVIVWANCLLAGATLSTVADYDNIVDGQYWKYNAGNGGADFQVVFSNGEVVPLAYAVTSFAGQGIQVALQKTISHIQVPSGTYTMNFQARKTPGTAYSFGARYSNMALLEGKK